MKVMVHGGEDVKSLPERFVDILDRLMGMSATILVSSRNGAPLLVQKYLQDKGYRRVVVYTGKGNPQNNVGGWPTEDTGGDVEDMISMFSVCDKAAVVCGEDCTEEAYITTAAVVNSVPTIVYRPKPDNFVVFGADDADQD